MDNQQKLQQRKAALKSKMELQRGELKKTFQEIREEIEPAALLRKAVSGALGFSGKKEEQAGGLLTRLPGPVSFLVDLLVRDPKWSLGLKLAGPVIMKFWPKASPKPEPNETDTKNLQTPKKTFKRRFFGGIREGISTLRGKIKRPPELPAQDIQKTEN